MDEIEYAGTTCWFVEAGAKFIFAQVIFKGEKSADLILWNICSASSCARTLGKRNMFSIIMCEDTWEAICFKVGMMLNTTKHYSLIPVGMILMFFQSHRVTGKLELVQWFCRAVARNDSNVCDSWLCKEDDCEEVLWVWWYGSFEHLIFLLKTVTVVCRWGICPLFVCALMCMCLCMYFCVCVCVWVRLHVRVYVNVRVCA